jgi:hypothetical protein
VKDAGKILCDRKAPNDMSLSQEHADTKSEQKAKSKICSCWLGAKIQQILWVDWFGVRAEVLIEEANRNLC